jgi:phosphate transport system protein
MRNRFDAQLEDLCNQLIEMGGLIERAIAGAIDALTEGDDEKARQSIAFDSEVDDKESLIEHLCLQLLMQQQPVAKDLRLISAALKMITDMERIGDQASDISEIAMHIGKASTKHLPDIRAMAGATIKMVTDSIDAFVRSDLALARAVVEHDDLVDDYFIKMRGELVGFIHGEPHEGELAVDWLMVVKYLERIGDHACNIAEWVIFAITGEHVDS